jgi:hypothetical protein
MAESNADNRPGRDPTAAEVLSVIRDARKQHMNVYTIDRK